MSLNPTRNILSKRTGLILVIVLITSINYGQITTYNQFWNKIQFNRTINQKWSAELNLGAIYSSRESSPNIFQENIQRSARVWRHSYFSPRWKFSSFRLTITTKTFLKLASLNLLSLDLLYKEFTILIKQVTH
jgi:hypothetical protein